MKERNKAIPAIYLILHKQGKVLIAKRQNTGYEDGKYQIPAGHLESGELPEKGLIREAKEEVGITLSKNDIKFSHVSYRPKHDATGDRVDFFFIVKKWKGEIKNMEPEKCSELKWVYPNKLPKNMTYHVKRGIEQSFKGNPFEGIDLKALKKAGMYKL